ncbi:MAG: serine/threonine-protein phosphatase [Lewinellaceae bacterium]|nr:serine/threonine-protein phosphatase [Saprospiraceae bacterium]MCB9313085.1 serine/threonine-protein phosphatase [Lewinellaceae bacterium]
MLELQIIGRTHVGQQRTLNEDTLAFGLDNEWSQWATVETLPDETVQLDRAAMILADGMGGAEAGEIASALACSSMQEYFSSALSSVQKDDDDIIIRLRQGLLLAHDSIVADTMLHPARRGMGTTIIAGLIDWGKLYVMWSGDSRVYRYFPTDQDSSGKEHPDHLQMISRDHSMVWDMVLQGELTAEEARVHTYSNVITQSLGDVQNKPSPDYRVTPLYKGDVLLFCTDGLNGMLSDQEIQDLFRTHQDLVQLADALIEAANLAGGTDNITLILVRVTNGPGRPHLEDIHIQDKVVTEGGASLMQKMKQPVDGPSVSPPDHLNQVSQLDHPGRRRRTRIWPFVLLFCLLPLFLIGLWWYLKVPESNLSIQERIQFLQAEDISSFLSSKEKFKFDSLVREYELGQISEDKMRGAIEYYEQQAGVLNPTGTFGTVPEGERTEETEVKREVVASDRSMPFWNKHFHKLQKDVRVLMTGIRSDPGLGQKEKEEFLTALIILEKEILASFDETGVVKFKDVEAREKRDELLKKYKQVSENYRKWKEEKAVPGQETISPKQPVSARQGEGESVSDTVKQHKQMSSPPIDSVKQSNKNE